MYHVGVDVDRAVSDMLLKDVNVVVLSSISPLITPLSDGDDTLKMLGALLSPSATAYPFHIVVSHELFGHEATRKLYRSIIAARFPHAFSAENPFYPKIHLLDVGLARKAQTRYRKASGTPSSLTSTSSSPPKEFQVSLEASNFTQFSNVLEISLKNLPSSSAQLSMRSALRVTGLMISQCERSLHDASRSAELGLEKVKFLRSNARHASRKAIDSMEFRTGPRGDLAKESVQLYFNDLPWWKLPWRADSIHAEISAVLGETYGDKFESMVGALFRKFILKLRPSHSFHSVAQLRGR